MNAYTDEALLHIIRTLNKDDYYIQRGWDDEDSALVSLNGQEAKIDKSMLRQLFNELLKKEVLTLYDLDDREVTRLLQSRIFSVIINSIYDGIYITDGEGRTIVVNSAYQRITGLSAEMVLDRFMEDLVDEEVMNESVSLHVLKRKEQVTMTQTIQNGKSVIVSGVPIFDQYGNVIYVINSVRDITELLKLKYENKELLNNRFAIEPDSGPMYLGKQLTKNRKMQSVINLLQKVAPTNAKILFTGRTGVGKTYLAKYVHLESNRCKENFMEINCAALPAHLIESELFGYAPGAFTGAQAKGKKGLLELAHQGTLFLDEITSLSLEMQSKLLTVLENQTFFPVGGTELKKINVRIIAASNQNIQKLVDNGKFREDLYYRLNVVEVSLPALKERQEDIIPLSKAFIEEYNQAYEVNKYFSLEVWDTFFEYQWPGNIRELRNTIENLVVTSDEDEVKLHDLPPKFDIGIFNRNKLRKAQTLKERMDMYERKIIEEALSKYKTTRKVADYLGVSQSTIVQKMKKWQTSD